MYTYLLARFRGAFYSIVAALCCLTSLPAFAQKATVRQDVIYRDGQPYARVQRSGSLLGYPNFSFKTLAGKEFMMMHYDDAAGDYRVVFFPGEEQTRLARSYGSTQVMAQEVVDNNFVQGDTFNVAGLKRFMLAHPASASPGAGRRAGNMAREVDEEVEGAADDVSEAILNIGEAIERAFDKDSVRRLGGGTSTRRTSGARAVAVGDRLIVGTDDVGSYTVRTEARGGMIFKIFTFRNTAGHDVAEATMEHVGATSCELVTLKDNRLATLPLSAWMENKVAEQIAEWLLRRRYL